MFEECEDFEGYYLNPYIENVAVNEDGRVIDLTRLCCCLPIVYGTFEYLTVNVSGHGTQPVHRLVAMTFHPKNYGDVVNHKDGDKFNNHKDNVEWVSYSDNVNHAYDTGLRKDNVVVEVMDLETSEIISFRSIQKTASHFKCNAEKIHRYLNSRLTYPFLGKYNLRRTDSEWKPLTKENIGDRPDGTNKEIVLIEESTGTYYLFDSMTACSKWLKTTRHTLGKHLIANTPILGYRVIPLAELNENNVDLVKVSNHHNKIVPVRKPKKIEVFDTVNNITTRWDSTEEFAFSHGAKKNTIQKSMHLKDGRWQNFIIKYV